jgi:hypothetical protein
MAIKSVPRMTGAIFRKFTYRLFVAVAGMGRNNRATAS